MPVRSPSWLAPLRGATLAVSSTLLTAVGHLAGGGTLPGLSPLVVLFPMLMAVLVGLADRRRGVGFLLLTLGAGQVVLHYLLVVLAPHGHESGAGLPAPEMLAMHAVATVLMAVMVRGADAALLALLAALGRVRLRRPSLLAVSTPLPTRAVSDTDEVARVAAGVVESLVRRGPPIAR